LIEQLSGTRELGVSSAAGSPDRNRRTRVTIEPAPEPSEINWANLELDRSYEYRAQALTYTCATVLVLGVMVLTSYIKSENILAYTIYGVEIQVGYYLVIGLGNPLLKSLLTFFSTTEGLDTATEEERSLFTKLSLTLHFNTVLIPIITAFLASAKLSYVRIDQPWYEIGGTVDGFLLLSLSNVAIDGILQIIPMGVIVNRYLVAPFVHSPWKLNKLYMPPEMPLGYLHAVSFKTIALCLLYSPIYPTAYLLTAAALVFIFWFTKFAVACHYRRPRQMDERMLKQLRNFVSFAVAEHIIISFFGFVQAVPSSYRGLSLIAPTTATVVWALFTCESYIPNRFKPESFTQWMLEYEEASYEEDDTQGISYADAEAQMQYSIERYMCPALTQKRSPEELDALCFASTRGARRVVEKWEKVEPEQVDATTDKADKAELL